MAKGLRYLFILFLVGALGCSSDGNTKRYNLTTTATPTEGGTVTPSSGEFEEGEEVEVSASSNEHWVFNGWQGDLSGDENPQTLTMDSNKSVAALFVKRDYPLTITTEGQGTVSEQVIQPKTTDYPHGTMVELTAEPAEGWIFEGWQGDIETTENPTAVTIESETEITAVFSGVDYSLEITVDGQGTANQEIVQPKTDYTEGAVVELTAVPEQHWVFVKWSGDLEGEDNPQTLTMDSDKQVEAHFTKRDYPLTVTTQGQGTVTEQVIQQKSTDYPHGTVVELTATTAEDWEFEGWQGDIETDENPITVTIEGETEITAVFSGVEYPLEVTIEGEGSVSEEVVQAKTDYPAGTLVELTGEPAENWIFSEWSGDLESQDNPAQITVDEPKQVTATFLRTYNLTTNVSPEEGGSITPEAGQYVRDTTLEVEAVASQGWQFVDWDGDFTGSVNPFNLTMNGDKTIIATFERQSFELSTTIEGEGEIARTLLSGEETGEDTYLYESDVRMTAIPEEGWNFLRWEGDIESEDSTIEVVVEENTSITAVFIEFEGGDGSESNPYQVATLEQLQKVGDYLDKHFIQIADINASDTRNWIREEMTDEGFIPIGNQSQKFTGSYDGQEYEITDLYIRKIADDDVTLGLFGYIEEAVVKNIGLSVEIAEYFEGAAGGLAGINNGIIQNVVLSGSIFSLDDDGTYLGGIVGLNLGAITNSTSKAVVKIDTTFKLKGQNLSYIVNGERGTGGIAGKNEGEIYDSNFSGDDTDGYEGNAPLGGLVGINSGIIMRSFSAADIDGFRSSAGIAVVNTGTIEECYSVGEIDGLYGAAGLVYLNTDNGQIINSFSSGYLSAFGETGGVTVGGLVGRNDGNAKITQSYSYRNVNGSANGGSSYVGGLVGENIGEAQITSSYSLGDISPGTFSGGKISVGGLVGLNTSTISETFATGTITVSNPEEVDILNNGGLIGEQINDGVTTTSYWDIDNSGQANGVGDGSSEGITALETGEMTGTNAEVNMDFDWGETWFTVPGDYPILYWQKEE